jgi:hypothetical protein
VRNRIAFFQVDLGNEVMKKFRLKRKTCSEGFNEKLESVFKDYYDWFYNPSKLLNAGVYILARGPIFPPPAFKVPIFYPIFPPWHPKNKCTPARAP